MQRSRCAWYRPLMRLLTLQISLKRLVFPVSSAWHSPSLIGFAQRHQCPHPFISNLRHNGVTTTPHQSTVRLLSQKQQSTTASTTHDSDVSEIRKKTEEALQLLDSNLASCTPMPALEAMIQDLEREQSDPDFWDESNANRASVVNAQLSLSTRMLTRIQQWHAWKGDIEAAWDILWPESSSRSTSELDREERALFVQELEAATQALWDDSRRYELELLLSGPYDAAPARVSITAGAGGTEANDWVADLKRMYERHCDRMGFSYVVEDIQDGDVVGFKSVELLITGPNAYGWFHGEKGAHRLVRLSPFNANNKRQTTFAGVDVAPDIFNNDLLSTLDIPASDLEITTMRAGGKGGQNVNKVSSAVRIKHIPSGLQVKCTQERSQSHNKEIALQRLKAQLLAIAQEQQVQKIQEIRGDMVEASWGAQIRNYVLHPYKMVKDQRTGWESSNAQAFLDGELLDDCIGAYLRYKAAQASESETKPNN
jgi:peptide chain release factor 2